MSYSRYSPEQVINEKYKELCSLLLSIPNDDEIKEKMKRNTI